MLNNKLADFVKKYPKLLDFLDRLNIDLGFGDKTVSEICTEYKIDKYFFIELMHLISSKNKFKPQYIDKFDIKQTISYLQQSHYSFLNEYLPRINYFITEIKKNEQSRIKDIEVLEKYMSDYIEEVKIHLSSEDNDIFPYIIDLLDAVNSKNVSEELQKRLKKYPIYDFMKIHDALYEKLDDLKNLLIKYFKPFQNNIYEKLLLKTIYELDEDIKLHDMIENIILYPQAEILEKRIKKFMVL